MRKVLTIVLFSHWAFPTQLIAENVINSALAVPDEIESVGGISTGLSNGGSAAFSGISSVRTNPAMLALEKNYEVSGSYHWPAVGGDFYQVGVVDSKTSDISAGVSLIRPSSSYKDEVATPGVGLKLPLKMRLAVGVGYLLEKVAIGVSGQIIDAYRYEETESGSQISRVRGNTVGVGMAGLITPSLRFAVSAENLANKQVSFVAPRFIRAGVAYLETTGIVSGHLDYISRAALIPMNSTSSDPGRQSLRLVQEDWNQSSAANDEQQVIASFTARAYDLLRIVGSYGGVVETKRQMFGGGVALVNKNWTFSYMAMRPDTDVATAHQAVSLEVNISI